MPCCTALQTSNFSDCNQSRTQLRVWWLEPGALTTLRRFSSLFIGYRCDNFQVGDTGSQVLERPSTWLSGRRLPSCRPRSSWLTVSRQYDAGRPSFDDVTGRQNICRRRTACLEQPSSCHPWSVTVAVNLRKAAENLFVCLRVAALVTYELAPWKCTD